MHGGVILGVLLWAGLLPATALAQGAVAPGARVFSAMVGDAEAVPVACFRPGVGWRSGEACMAWLPREGTLRALAEGEARLLGHAPRVKCSGHDAGRRGLRVKAPLQAGAVLWPADPAVRFEWMREEATPAPVPREALAELYRLAGKHLGVGPGELGVHVSATWPVEVDGDGVKDLLVLAETSGREELRAELGVAVLGGPTPRTVALGFSRGAGSLRVAGQVDLDADGASELWLQEETEGAFLHRLVRWKGQGFETLGRHECPLLAPGERAEPEVPYEPEENACRREHRDRLEPNDAPARATRPRLAGAPMAEATYEELGLHAGDADWFRLPVPAHGNASAFVPAQSLNAWLGLQLYAEDGTTLLAGGATAENAVGWSNPDARPRTVLLKVTRQGRGCAFYSLSLASGEDGGARLRAQVRRLPLPTAEQRAASPHPDREAELLALTLSPGFLAEPSDVARLSRELAAIRAAEPSLRDVRYEVPGEGQRLAVFFTDATAAGQGVYSAWDGLNAAFGLKALKPGVNGGLELEFGPVLHLTRVAALYRALPGVIEATPAGLLLDGSTVHVCRKGEVAWYTFDIGSGDCPSGCLQRTWHVFRVARPGAAPERMGTVVPGAPPEPEWLRELRRDCPPAARGG